MIFVITWSQRSRLVLLVLINTSKNMYKRRVRHFLKLYIKLMIGLTKMFRIYAITIYNTFVSDYAEIQIFKSEMSKSKYQSTEKYVNWKVSY